MVDFPSNEEIYRAIGKLEGKVDLLIGRFDRFEANAGRRIRGLELFRAWLLGIAAVATTAVAAIASLIGGK